jgi:hypothetical protein
MGQDQTMDRERVQTRERDRTHAGDGTQAQTQARKQDQSGAAQSQAQVQARSREQAQLHAGAGKGIYGGNLMTEQERNRYREQVGALGTDEERAAFEARHREQMQQRSRERNVPAEITDE